MRNYRTSFILFASSLALSILGNQFIIRYFPIRVVNPDIIFKLFPYSLSLEYITDFLFFIGIGIFLCFYLIPNRKRLLDVINMVSIMYIFRALFMVLTPMMRPTGIDFPSHGFFRDFISQLGMFPSGHIGLMALFYFIIDGRENLLLKRSSLIILIIISVLMVASRGHYSIDVIGGIMLSYIIVNEYNKKMKN